MFGREATPVSCPDEPNELARGDGNVGLLYEVVTLAENPERDVDHIDAECVEVLGDGNDLVVELLEV
jgi:hypothetical protein